MGNQRNGVTAEEREVLSTILKLRGEKKTYGAIALVLNEQGHTNRWGLPFDQARVRKIYDGAARAPEALVTTLNSYEQRLELSLMVLRVAGEGTGPRAKVARQAYTTFCEMRDAGRSVEDCVEAVRHTIRMGGAV